MESKIIILEATFYRRTIRDSLSSESYWRPLSLENYWRPPFIGELLETPFHRRTIGDPLSSENYWRPPFIGGRTIGDPLSSENYWRPPFIGELSETSFHRRTIGDPLWYINRSETLFPPDFSFRRKHVHLTPPQHIEDLNSFMRGPHFRILLF